MNSYDIGDQVRLTVAFTDEYGAGVDPTVIICKTVDPDGHVTDWSYGVDEALTRTDTGAYALDFVIDQAGRWAYRWESSGTVTAAAEGQFNVRRSNFT